MESKRRLVRKLAGMIADDFRKVTPTPPPAERVVPFMTKVIWTLAVFMAAYVAAGVLVL